MNNKIIVPKQVADAIAHYVDLADTKTEALQDILRLGYEAERSEIILRHFEHDYDELMEALICGYEVAETPEDEIRKYYTQHLFLAYSGKPSSKNAVDAIKFTLNKLGIKIAGVNTY
jgi:DNA integrity scanning protein DisA with diadenylate cyclase activity